MHSSLITSVLVSVLIQRLSFWQILQRGATAGLLTIVVGLILMAARTTLAQSSVVAWGANDYGQCNVPAPNADFVALAVGGGNSLGTKSRWDCFYGDIARTGPLFDPGEFARFALCCGLAALHLPDCDELPWAGSDRDGNGNVDLSDFVILALWFGRQSSQTVPNCPP